MKSGCSTINSHNWYRAKTDIGPDQAAPETTPFMSLEKKSEKSNRTLGFDLERVCFVPSMKTTAPVGSISFGGCLPDWHRPPAFTTLFSYETPKTLNICWLRLRRKLSYGAKSAILGWCAVLVLIFLDPEPPGGPSTQSARRSRPLASSTGI